MKNKVIARFILGDTKIVTAEYKETGKGYEAIVEITFNDKTTLILKVADELGYETGRDVELLEKIEKFLGLEYDMFDKYSLTK